MFYQLRKSSLLEFIQLSDRSISIGTVASQVFVSDQLCPVALIDQILKAECFHKMTCSILIANIGTSVYIYIYVMT